MIDFNIEWDGAENESLSDLLTKTQLSAKPQADSLNSHLIATRKSSSISEVIALWMGFNGVPETLKSSSIFILVLSVTTLALLSPSSLSLIPNSAGEILDIFDDSGWDRVISKSKLIKVIGDKQVVEEGIKFLFEKKLIEIVDANTYRLLEVPLANVRISFK